MAIRIQETNKSERRELQRGKKIIFKFQCILTEKNRFKEQI